MTETGMKNVLYYSLLWLRGGTLLSTNKS